MLTNIQENAGAEVPSLANAAREMSRFVERAGRVCSGKRCREFGQFKGNGRCCLLDSALSLSLSSVYLTFYLSKATATGFFVVLLSIFFLLLSRLQPISALLLTSCANFIFISPIDSFALNFCSQPPCLSLSHSDPLKMAAFHSPFNSIQFVSLLCKFSNCLIWPPLFLPNAPRSQFTL